MTGVFIFYYYPVEQKNIRSGFLPSAFFIREYTEGMSETGLIFLSIIQKCYGREIHFVPVVCGSLICNCLKTSKKIRTKIFAILKFPYLCLPNYWG